MHVNPKRFLLTKETQESRYNATVEILNSKLAKNHFIA